MFHAYNDSAGRKIFQYRLLYEFPEFVKEASVSEINDIADLPENAFALPKQRCYPCHTKAAAWLSYLYFINEGQSNQAVKDRLHKFASFFGIEDEIKKIQERHQALQTEKSAQNLSQDAFLLPSKRRYPVVDKDSLLKAGQWFAKNVVSLPFDDRREFATNLLDKAYRWSIALPEEVEETLQKCAGLAIYDPQAAAVRVWSRVKTAEEMLRSRSYGQDVVNAYRTFKKEVEENPQWGLSLHKSAELAQRLAHLDNLAGLDEVLDDPQQLPEFVFGTIPVCKVASYMQNTVRLKTGSVYSLDDLKKVPMSVWKDLFTHEKMAQLSLGGLGMLMDMEKVAHMLQNLDVYDSAFVQAFLASHGVKPIWGRVKV